VGQARLKFFMEVFKSRDILGLKFNTLNIHKSLSENPQADLKLSSESKDYRVYVFQFVSASVYFS
jgi:hypothetical protein